MSAEDEISGRCVTQKRASYLLPGESVRSIGTSNASCQNMLEGGQAPSNFSMNDFNQLLKIVKRREEQYLQLFEYFARRRAETQNSEEEKWLQNSVRSAEGVRCAEESEILDRCFDMKVEDVKSKRFLMRFGMRVFEIHDATCQRLKQLRLFDFVQNSLQLKFNEMLHKHLMRHPLEVYPIVQFVVFQGRKKVKDLLARSGECRYEYATSPISFAHENACAKQAAMYQRTCGGGTDSQPLATITLTAGNGTTKLVASRSQKRSGTQITAQAPQSGVVGKNAQALYELTLQRVTSGLQAEDECSSSKKSIVETNFVKAERVIVFSPKKTQRQQASDAQQCNKQVVSPCAASQVAAANTLEAVDSSQVPQQISVPQREKPHTSGGGSTLQQQSAKQRTHLNSKIVAAVSANTSNGRKQTCSEVANKGEPEKRVQQNGIKNPNFLEKVFLRNYFDVMLVDRVYYKSVYSWAAGPLSQTLNTSKAGVQERLRQELALRNLEIKQSQSEYLRWYESNVLARKIDIHERCLCLTNAREDSLQKVTQLNEAQEETNKVVSRRQSQSKQGGASQHQLLVTEKASTGQRRASSNSRQNFVTAQVQATPSAVVKLPRISVSQNCDALIAVPQQSTKNTRALSSNHSNHSTRAPEDERNGMPPTVVRLGADRNASAFQSKNRQQKRLMMQQQHNSMMDYYTNQKYTGNEAPITQKKIEDTVLKDLNRTQIYHAQYSGQNMVRRLRQQRPASQLSLCYNQDTAQNTQLPATNAVCTLAGDLKLGNRFDASLSSNNPSVDMNAIQNLLSKMQQNNSILQNVPPAMRKINFIHAGMISAEALHAGFSAASIENAQYNFN